MKIINVHALSLDGSIGSNSIESDEERLNYGLTSKEDQARVRKLLETSDAVITGSSSLISAGSAWDIKNQKGNNVSWYVYTNKGIPENLSFNNQEHIKKTIVSHSPLNNFIPKKNFQNICYGENDPAEFLVSVLRAENAEQVLLFGGGKVNKMFFDKNLVSHLEYTFCPVVLGGSSRVNLIESGVEAPCRAKLLHTSVENNHVFLSYELENINSLLK